MKKILDVMIDTETLSLRPSAAIFQISAVPFSLYQDNKPIDKDLTIDINPISEAMYGFSFDEDTIEWWSKNKPANNYFKDTLRAYSIEDDLIRLTEVLNYWKVKTNVDELVVWSQGTDFDISVLRHAYRKVFGSEDKIPWKYNNVRDARTYFLEAARIFAQSFDNPYDIIKTKGVEHHSLDDCYRSIKAVKWAYKKYSSVFSMNDNKENEK